MHSIIYHNDEETIAIDNKEYDYIVKLDNNLNIIKKSKIKTDLKSSFVKSFIRFNDFYYISCYIRINKYLIIKMNLDFEIIEEEYVNTYICDFLIMNNQICAIIDEPRRYTSNPKKLIQLFLDSEVLIFLFL